MEKKNRLLTVHHVGDQIVIAGDQRTVARASRDQTLIDAFKSLLEDLEDDNGEENQEYLYNSTETILIPPLFAQEGDKTQGWGSKNVEIYLVLLFNILGAGKGGPISLTNKLRKPAWFSSKVDWKNFQSASHSTMVENVDLIKGIFSYFNLDMKTHCKYPPQPAEDPVEPQQEQPQAEADLENHEAAPVPVGGVMEENHQPGVGEVLALPEEFLFEASVENHDALHASIEDVEGIADGQEDDLPEPEAVIIQRPAIVQVIVQRRKRKTVEDTVARTASKRAKKVPAKLLS